MKITEFFKPTWIKIIITLFIFIVAATITRIFDACFTGIICPTGLEQYYLPFKCSAECLPKDQIIRLNLMYRLPLYLYELVMAYFISCILGYLSRKK